MIKGVRKIGFALLNVLGLPIYDAHVVSSHKKMSLAPLIQSICEPGDWLVPALSALGSRHLVPKPHSDHSKATVWGGIF